MGNDDVINNFEMADDDDDVNIIQETPKSLDLNDPPPARMMIIMY